MRECIVRLLSDVEYANAQLSSSEADEITLHLANRSDDSTTIMLQTQIAATLDRAMQQMDHSRQAVRDPAGALFGKQTQRFESLSDKLNQTLSAAVGKFPVFKYLYPPVRPVTMISHDGFIQYSEAPRNRRHDSITYPTLVASSRASSDPVQQSPYVHIKSSQGTALGAEYLENGYPTRCAP